MLGMTTVELTKKLNLAQPTISQAAMRGRKIAEEEGLKIDSMTGKEGRYIC
jgi:type VI protein secretion system component Hcp